MIYPSSADWSAWAISDNLSQFLTLLWWEMFDDDTPDTWQVRSCNTRTVLAELASAAATAEVVETYRHAARALVAEAIAIAGKDPVVARCYPFVPRYLKRWENADIAPTQVSELKRVARVMCANLQGYRESALETVRRILAEPGGNRKEDLAAAAMSLAVEISSSGYSTEYVQSVFRSQIATESGAPFIQRLDSMMSLLDGTDREYVCTFLVNGIRHDTAAVLPETMQVLIGATPGDIGEKGKQFFERGSKHDVYLSVKTRAVDPISAWHRGEQELSRLFAVLNLYGLNDVYGLKSLDALVVDADGHAEIVQPSSARRQHLENSRRKLEKAGRLMAGIGRLPSDDADQLLASLQYHRLSLTATTDEARLVSLWIALESLCRSGEGSIIDRVVSKISFHVAAGNIRKNLVSLAIYLKFLWDKNSNERFLKLFPRSTARKIDPAELLAILVLPDTDPRLTELFALASCNPLVCYRLYRAKTGLLSKPSALKENLDRNRQDIDWQLRRIYGVRNEIMHSGASIPHIRQLIQHLHSYYIVTIQSLIVELDRRPAWGIAEAFEARCQLFSDATRVFAGGETIRVSQRTLLDIAHCHHGQEEPLVWPTRPPVNS